MSPSGDTYIARYSLRPEGPNRASLSAALLSSQASDASSRSGKPMAASVRSIAAATATLAEPAIATAQRDASLPGHRTAAIQTRLVAAIARGLPAEPTVMLPWRAAASGTKSANATTKDHAVAEKVAVAGSAPSLAQRPQRTHDSEDRLCRQTSSWSSPHRLS